ncbi:MAG: Fe-S cluster assembly protein SufD [Bacteroidota bacterium]
MQLTSPASQVQQAIARHFSTLDKKHPFYTAKQQAWHAWGQVGFPSLKNEAYKYTPIADMLAGVFDLSQPATTSKLTQEAILPLHHHGLDAYQLVLLNGQLSGNHSQLGNHKHSLQVLTFSEAYQQHQALFLQHLSQHAQDEVDAFEALNTALFEEGTFIYIADHAVLEKPLLIYHIIDTQATQSLTYPRLLIAVGQNSQASLVIDWRTLGQHPSFINAVTEIMLGKDARLDYCTLQIQMGQAYQVNTTQCYQASQSEFNNYTFTWDGMLVRNNLHIHIDAPHSEANMYGLYCLDGRQHVDNHTRVNHTKPHTQSYELYRGILAGEATGVFNGRIYVRSEAQKTHAFQANNNLLLTDQATIHTKPQLEIWADDVKCSHGATTGQLDEAQLFYLTTRGIPADTARYMLLNAFASDVIDRVPLVVLKPYLQQALEKKLSTLGIKDY